MLHKSEPYIRPNNLPGMAPVPSEKSSDQPDQSEVKTEVVKPELSVEGFVSGFLSEFAKYTPTEQDEIIEKIKAWKSPDY